MPKRTLAILAAVAFGALALPFGLPTIAHATGPTYASLSIKPLPLEQPGTLSPTGTNTSSICVQPLTSQLKVVPGATVFLSIASGLFTAPPGPGGSATAEGTALTATAQSFIVQATCNYANLESSGTLADAVPVTYTGPDPKLTHGRDVIGATSDGTSFDSTTGECTGAGVCNTGTYAFSPVANYVFSAVPIAPTGSLAASGTTTFTVTAVDNSTPTPQPVPGAFVDLSLTSSAGGGGTATGVDSFTNFDFAKITDAPQRFGSDNAGQVAITYTAPATLPTTGTDTITAQNRPTSPTFAPVSTTYTYANGVPFSQGPYTAVTPFRVCDTRPVAPPGIVSNQCNTGAGSGPFLNNQTRPVTVTGGSVPSDATAVVINLTAITPSANTYLKVYPAGSGVSATSNINPQHGQVVANLVEVGVGTGGQIEVYNNLGTVNVAIDVEGFVDPTSPGFFHAAVPTRICDTRAVGPGIVSNQCNDSGAGQHPIGPQGVLNFNVTSSGSPIPSTGVTAVVFNLTAINPTVATDVAAYPGPVSNPHPTVSNINLLANTAVPNRVIVAVPSGCTTACTVNLWNSVGSVNVAVDIDGWFSTTAGAQFTSLTPARLCDTRVGNGSDQGCNEGLIGPGGALNIDVTGIDGLPVLNSAHTPVAVVVNVTALEATAPTFETVYPGPAGTVRPNASDLNVPVLVPVTNLVVAEVGTDGTINIYNNLGSVDLIVDVYGYYS